VEPLSVWQLARFLERAEIVAQQLVPPVELGRVQALACGLKWR
jgi:hypothetical protein